MTCVDLNYKRLAAENVFVSLRGTSLRVTPHVYNDEADGARLIDVLRAQPNAPRLVVYAEDSGDIPRKAMAAGAAGFVSRSESVDRLVETCAAVAKGQMVFPFLDIRGLKQDPIESLSPRERTLLEALSKGLTNRELARDLEISENTVKFHLSNLFEKLSVKNRAQAIAFYYANRATRGEM